MWITQEVQDLAILDPATWKAISTEQQPVCIQADQSKILAFCAFVAG
jgi:hypothetical protein